MVPGGGWDPATQAWHPARPDFLLPSKRFPSSSAPSLQGLRQSPLFRAIPPTVWQQDWVVHCLPVGTGAPALKYLAPYVFQVAISNRRIVSLEHDQVSFVYTDARTRQRHTCTLDALAFIDRFLQHVLPKGFCKVRYYRCFSPSQRPTLQAVRCWFAQATGRAPRPTTRSGCAPARRPTLPQVWSGHDRGRHVAPHRTLPADHGRKLNRVRSVQQPDAAARPAPGLCAAHGLAGVVQNSPRYPDSGTARRPNIQ